MNLRDRRDVADEINDWAGRVWTNPEASAKTVLQEEKASREETLQIFDRSRVRKKPPKHISNTIRIRVFSKTTTFHENANKASSRARRARSSVLS